MKRASLVLVFVALALGPIASGCAKEESASTVAGPAKGGDGSSSSSASATTTAKPATTVTTRAATTTTTAATDGASGPRPNSWKLINASGPYAGALQMGGDAECSTGATGMVWTLESGGAGGPMGSMQFVFDQSEEPGAATVAITTAGDAAPRAEGTADVVITPGEANTVAFTFALKYQDVTKPDGATGEIRGAGVCAQAPAPAP